MNLFFQNISNKPWSFSFKVFLLLIVGFQFSFSQNQAIRTIDPAGIERILIRGDQIFEIEIYAEDRQTIELYSLLDGEYENDFQISSLRNNEVLEIQLMSSVFSDIPDDKRNAHKVVAATLKLVVPRDCKIEVVSDVGYLIAKGKFDTVLANLQNGYFSFEGLAKYLRVETLQGNIYLKSKNTMVDAYSAKGTVSGLDVVKGQNRAVLKSIKGDIIIKHLDN